MTRRQRVDSAASAVKLMAAAAEGELLPPAHCSLGEAALPFWRGIIQGRARAEWDETPALLVTASNLAWTQWQIAQARGWIDDPDSAPEGLKAPAIISRLNDLQRLEMAYLRTLQQHARGAQGEAGRAADRRKTAKDVEAATPFGEDDLIGRPPASLQ